MTRFRPLGLLLAAAVLVPGAACAGDDQDLDQLQQQLVAGAERLVITSDAFAEGEPIPARYTCDGDNLSPPLTIEGLPGDTATLAAIVDDPDAPGGTWVHWIEFNIPATGHLGEGASSLGSEGNNSWNERGYRGPCPPSGEHRYFFKIYALDRELTLSEAAGKQALLSAMNGHLLAYGELIGTYRSR